MAMPYGVYFVCTLVSFIYTVKFGFFNTYYIYEDREGNSTSYITKPPPSHKHVS